MKPEEKALFVKLPGVYRLAGNVSPARTAACGAEETVGTATCGLGRLPAFIGRRVGNSGQDV